MRRELVPAAVVVFAAALGVYVLASRGAPDESVRDEPVPDVLPAATEPAALEPPAPPLAQPSTHAHAHGHGEANQDVPRAPIDPSQFPEPGPPTPPQRSGPLDELKRAFQTESRDSDALPVERRIESEFKKADIPPGMLKAALCRKTVCRAEVRWLPERSHAYSIALMRLVDTFELRAGIEPEAKPDENGELLIDVYLPRRPTPLIIPAPALAASEP